MIQSERERERERGRACSLMSLREQINSQRESVVFRKLTLITLQGHMDSTEPTGFRGFHETGTSGHWYQGPGLRFSQNEPLAESWGVKTSTESDSLMSAERLFRGRVGGRKRPCGLLVVYGKSSV